MSDRKELKLKIGHPHTEDLDLVMDHLGEDMATAVRLSIRTMAHTIRAKQNPAEAD